MIQFHQYLLISSKIEYFYFCSFKKCWRILPLLFKQKSILDAGDYIYHKSSTTINFFYVHLIFLQLFYVHLPLKMEDCLAIFARLRFLTTVSQKDVITSFFLSPLFHNVNSLSRPQEVLFLRGTVSAHTSVQKE